MKKESSFREIPYNYTSFSDKEIVLTFFPVEFWDVLDQIKEKRVTGRSAKLLFEVLGDLFILDRNPYLYDAYLSHGRSRSRLYSLHQGKIATVIQRADMDEVRRIARETLRLSETFFTRMKQEHRRRLKALAVLSTVTKPHNIKFSPFHKVTHVTDATDWRVQYPFAIVYPASIREIPRVIRKARRLGLSIIPRGGGTGLTGGAVPVRRNTLIINTEKLQTITGINHVMSGASVIPVVSIEAGVITDDVTEYCEQRGFIFATDPTSGWASTIGGNIAENSGGKKALMWGTAIDNVYSFRMFDPAGNLIEVRRKDHPYRKILAEDTVVFDVYAVGRDEAVWLRSVSLTGSALRKKGLGKDITNKALNGLPGLQKEGGDGIIVSAEFVLYRPWPAIATICLEFFGESLAGAAQAIVRVRDRFVSDPHRRLTALEHFDDKYVRAIQYRNKSQRVAIPKAVLLVDVECDDLSLIEDACQKIIEQTVGFDCESFVAYQRFAREKFWKDRKNLGAIARHTNAFKLNEDIVIPIESLPAFSSYVDELNELKQRENLQALFEETRLFLDDDAFIADEFVLGKKALFLGTLAVLGEQLEGGSASPVALAAELAARFEQTFHGYQELTGRFRHIHGETLKKTIMLATHMHAGDGNIHVNIPVNSSDYAMLKDAERTVAGIFHKTAELGGVISGEHGIGLTKLQFLTREIIDDYQKYKAQIDPDNVFNPDKLIADFNHNAIYTPSLNLLEIEAFILEATELKTLTEQVSACVRCGKCKQSCHTNHPRATMFYSPRNKILALSLIVEAVLYEAQVHHRLDSRQLANMKEIATHCTVCHKCQIPCPVAIDFGKVTLAIRELMNNRRIARMAPLTACALAYLSIKNYLGNVGASTILYRFIYPTQRLISQLNRPVRRMTRRLMGPWTAPIESALPSAGGNSLRETFHLTQTDCCYVFSPPEGRIAGNVLYFPGCGSERMFPSISFASVSLLCSQGFRVVLPPEYLCCGYPFLANGRTTDARGHSYRNSVILHRIANTLSYMEIRDIVVSCGTCFEMLEQYQLGSIFPRARLIDIAEFLATRPNFQPKDLPEEKSLVSPVYHVPCHNPIKANDLPAMLARLLGKSPVFPDHCCGEGGTMALSHAELSGTLRRRKTETIHRCLAEFPMRDRGVTVLTSCPSCVQGLSRAEHGKHHTGKHLVDYLAEEWLGKDYKANFIREMREKGRLEPILL